MRYSVIFDFYISRYSLLATYKPDVMKTYRDAIDYLYGLQYLGIKFGLSNIKKILKSLNNPQKKYKIIHVVGTNGKGSVCSFLANILSKSGYRVGLYTSPHLVDFCERIQIDGKKITPDHILRLAKKIKKINERLALKATFFEVVTALAFEYFRYEDVDFAVVECGMGGRWDATNVVPNPLVTVITSIGMDHREYLGNSLQKITQEKAGAIKRRGVLFSHSQKREIIEIVEDFAKKKKAQFYSLGRDFYFRNPRSFYNSLSKKGNGVFSYPKYQMFDFCGDSIGVDMTDLKIGLLGWHQIENAALATGVAIWLQKRGVQIDQSSLREALLGTYWPGRMEILDVRVGSRWKHVLMDAAHNVQAIQTLIRALKTQLSFSRLNLVLGILKDKDIRGIIKRIVPIADRVILVSPFTERSWNPEMGKDIIYGISRKGEVEIFHEVDKGISRILKISSEQDLICITGSLYTVGEAREHILRGWTTKFRKFN